MKDVAWNNKDFCLSKRGGRARLVATFPYRVVDARGVVLASCPDEASARKFARSVSEGGDVSVERMAG